jgi:hypothetical protein
MMYKKGVVVSLGLLFILFVVVRCLTVGKTPISNEDAVYTSLKSFSILATRNRDCYNIIVKSCFPAVRRRR